MRVAVFDPVTGQPVRLLMSGRPSDIAHDLATTGMHWGFPSRVLDDTPHAWAQALAALPTLEEFDAEVGTPTPFEAP